MRTLTLPSTKITNPDLLRGLCWAVKQHNDAMRESYEASVLPGTPEFVPLTREQFFQNMVTTWLVDMARREADAVAAICRTTYPTMTEEQKAAALEPFGITDRNYGFS